MRKGLVKRMTAGAHHQFFRRLRLSVSIQLSGRRGTPATSNRKQVKWLTPGTLLPPLKQRDCLPVAEMLFRKHSQKPPPRLNSDLRKALEPPGKEQVSLVLAALQLSIQK